MINDRESLIFTSKNNLENIHQYANEKFIETNDLWSLHSAFHDVWWSLPDNQGIHYGTFNVICDLCSESWAIDEGSMQ